jgi:hypothetical protein
MDYLQKLFSHSRKRQRPAALLSSILNRVPLDILVCIIEYLLPESAVAFSLTCKHLKYLLGTRYIKKVNSSTKDTLALLNLLALDLPNHIVCSPCGRLHSMENLLRYNRATYSADSTIRKYNSLRLPPCISEDWNSNISAVTELFGTAAFKMVIKRYHQQPECIKLLEIISSKAAKIITTEDYVWQYREDCRVARGCLMHRLQSVYISWKCPTLTATNFRRNPPSERICPHLNLKTSIQNNQSGVQRCQKCRTEYRIDFKYYEGYGLAMFFSRWKDLGPGPESEVWMQHLPITLAAFAKRLLSSRLGSQTSVESQTHTNHWPWDESISFSFGDGSGFKFDSLLTSKNRVALFPFQRQCRMHLK